MEGGSGGQCGHVTLREQKVLAHHCFTDANPVKTPMEPGVRLSKRDYCPSVVDPTIHAEYHTIMGHISFMVQMTCPHLAFAFAELSKFVQCPGVPHLKAASRVLAYLAGTAHEGITYSRPIHDRHVNGLFGWVDSDYAADQDTCRSVTGYVISLNNWPISWKAKRQSCTTLSSAEAEFVAASLCGQEVIYLRNLLRDLGHSQGACPTTIYKDNASCILMSENPVSAERSRHIDTHKYFLGDMVRDGLLKLKKCAGRQNVADALTKSLPGPSFHKHSKYLYCSQVLFEAFRVSIGACLPSSKGKIWHALQAHRCAAPGPAAAA
eukprot:265218-Rhodomonas_salina.1